MTQERLVRRKEEENRALNRLRRDRELRAARQQPSSGSSPGGEGQGGSRSLGFSSGCDVALGFAGADGSFDRLEGPVDGSPAGLQQGPVVAVGRADRSGRGARGGHD